MRLNDVDFKILNKIVGTIGTRIPKKRFDDIANAAEVASLLKIRGDRFWEHVIESFSLNKEHLRLKTLSQYTRGLVYSSYPVPDSIYNEIIHKFCEQISSLPENFEDIHSAPKIILSLDKAKKLTLTQD